MNNINHHIRKRKASVSESMETSESISETLETKGMKAAPTLQDHEAANKAYGGTRTTRLTKQAWLKNVSLSRWRPTGTTRPTRKEPYTGFIFTQRPRWFHSRGHPRFEPYPVPPPYQHATHLPSHATISPPRHLPPPTSPPVETTTQWWPPGVSLGSRPPVSRIPIHVIYPEIAKWEMNWPGVRVRTSGTRYTYAPEVERYPVTFDWNVPRSLRTDKWTQRPYWPLETPLFSSEAYDYLEERTLPRILESGETEFPPTSPLPWWTYPPWWLEKKAVETVNGTTPRPYTRRSHQHQTSEKDAATFGTTASAPTEDVVHQRRIIRNEREVAGAKQSAEGMPEARVPTEKTDLAGIKMKHVEIGTASSKSQGMEMSGAVSRETTLVPLGVHKPKPYKKLHRKTHHKGPWWHLTIVEHLTPKPPSGEAEENKRGKRSPKLVRQNAFRRKWKKLRQQKNSSYTLDLKEIKPLGLTEGNESPSIQRVLSNFTFTWPKVSERTLSKIYIEDVLVKALDELKEHLTHVTARSGINYSEGSREHTVIQVEKHLADLKDLFLSALNNFPPKQGSSLLFHIFTNEIGREMVNYLLNHTNIVRQELDRLLFERKVGQRNGQQSYRNHLEKSRIIHLYKLFCTYDLIHHNNSDKIINIFKTLYGKNNMIEFLNRNATRKNSLNVEGQKLLLKKSGRNEALENNLFMRKKREDVVDITECPFNLSAQSVEQVVGEIVDELVEEMSIDEINEEIKTDVLTAMHENQLKRLGKTNINRDVLKAMVKLESVDEAKFRNATEDSVRRVIMKMVNEVLNILRQTPWMKDLIIKLFEEGYSVDSVLETISNQISVEELMNSMEKDGINITRYQRKLVREEFKGYKSLLRKMLTQEVQLWEYQLSKNQTLMRHRRDVSSALTDENSSKTHNTVGVIRTSYHIIMKKGNPETSRIKRDVNDNEISKSSERKNDVDEYDEVDEELDKELAELKKSSMPKREKMKVLRKRLKGLLSQTENPDDIVFPDNFEEELMRTESFYEEEITQSPPRFKQRIRWNVRTKKPTTKVITFPMKIRLNRGRPFVPLTTTEEQTNIMVVTQTPSRKYRTRKPAATRKAFSPTRKPLPPSTKSKRQFWLDFTTAPTDQEVIKSTDKVPRMTLKPLKAFSTLRTFKTMKFIQKTKQPVISLQEFLKRRNDFRREKQGDMFNRPSSEDDIKQNSKDSSNLSDLSEEEEEFSFEAKLSAEVNPSVFTFRPPTSTSETTSVLDEPSSGHTLASTEPTVENLLQKVTKKKTPRRRPAARSNKTRTKRPPTKAYVVTEATTNLTTQVSENAKNKTDGEKSSRRKRDLSFLQSITDSTKMERDFNDVTIPPLVINKEKFTESKKNTSCQSLEDRIKLSNWSYGVKQPKEAPVVTENKTDSFETYQQEHKKWFGIKKRGVPVNNFDIDWEQMRRKLEINQMSAWQWQKSSVKPTSGKQRKNERNATPLTQATTPLFTDSSEKPSNLLDNLYKSALKKTKTKSFAKYYISEESIDSRVKDFVYPPFGRMEKDGHTAFGRLYQGKRHYQLEDSREKRFNAEDLQRLINKTYDPVFRVSTHRKSNWNNRTFDPNYVFTQFVPLPGKSRTRSRFTWREAVGLFENENKTKSPTQNPFTLEVDSVFKQKQLSMKPKYKIFSEEENATAVNHQRNETYVMTRSKRVPWENSTDIETYKVYIRSRKRFYNKTLDIAFSYYIFHKFRCGNKTRDLGYGRMSNVVNRWYNKTFVAKFRPDMFYIRNRYKRGKEFNYFKDEMNEVHATISYGEFDPIRWMQVATEANLDESSKTKSLSDKEKEEYLENKKKKRIMEVFSSVFPKSTRVPETNLKLSTTGSKKLLTEPTKFPTKKASFFQAVKEKGFGFFRSLFRKQESDEGED